MRFARPNSLSLKACGNVSNAGDCESAVLLVLLPLLARLAGTLILPILAVPVSLVGTFRCSPAIRLLHQHTCQCGPGPCYRFCGRRRDCVCRRCAATYLRWPGSEGLGPEGPERASGPIVGLRLVGFSVVSSYGVFIPGHHRETLFINNRQTIAIS